MKKTYVRPTMVGETFVANEYFAVCGVVNGKYVFTCDAPAGTVYYYSGNTAIKLGGYEPCSKKHETTGPDAYYEGFVDYNKNKKEDEGESALVWIEWNRYPFPNYHASASLSQTESSKPRS